MLRLFVFAAMLLSCSAFVAAPASYASMKQRHASPMAAKKDAGPPPFSGFGSAEEERRQKLEVGTNWPPRTSTVSGKGYQFFQGPTPKTGVQNNLPDFFDSSTVDGVQDLGGKQTALIGIAAVGTAALVGALLTL